MSNDVLEGRNNTFRKLQHVKLLKYNSEYVENQSQSLKTYLMCTVRSYEQNTELLLWQDQTGIRLRADYCNYY